MSSLRSKKLLAYLVAEITWKGAILYMIHHGTSEVLLTTVVIVTGFLEVGYIGGQAWLDRYLKIVGSDNAGSGKPMEGRPSPSN